MSFEKLTEITVWPVSMIVMVLGACLIFRSPLQKLIGRMKKAGYGNKIIEFGEDQAAPDAQQKQIEQPKADLPPPAPADAIGTPPIVAAYTAAEQELVTQLNIAKMPAERERAWLVRGVIANRTTWVHERNYRLIVGSQLSLIVAANAFPRPHRRNARDVYEMAQQQNPDLYKNFTFEAWLKFPIDQGLLTMDSPSTDVSTISITPLGQDFLHYLVANSLTAPKSG